MNINLIRRSKFWISIINECFVIIHRLCIWYRCTNHFKNYYPLTENLFWWMNMSYIKCLSSWVFHVFVHGSDIRLSFSKLPLIRIHIIWPTKLIYAKQEESFWHDYVFLRIDLDCLWTILTITKKMKPKLFIRAQGWYIPYFYKEWYVISTDN